MLTFEIFGDKIYIDFLRAYKSEKKRERQIRIMSEHKTLCMGCMEPLDSAGVCPYCGYDDSSPSQPSYLPPKTVLDGRYIVGKLLSANGESALYIGYDRTAEEKVFIREYMPDALCSRNRESPDIKVGAGAVVQYKNYMSEFIELNKNLSRLRSATSHIVAPIDMFSQNNTAYVILQYAEAITLKQYLADNAGELTWDQVKKLFPPLLTTLACIHNAGILHRGISLENILVTDRGELLLSGFSISAVRTVNTDLAPELYTGCSAPEQYSSNEWIGTWTDVYGVAAVMYRLLTGCMPTEPMARVGNDDLLEPAKINPNVPANVSKVIMQAMRLNCNQRIQTVTDFVTKLFEQPSYMQKMPNGATQTIPINVPPRRRTSQQKRRKKSSGSTVANIFMIIGAAILIGIVIAAFALLARMLLPETQERPIQSGTQSGYVFPGETSPTFPSTEPTETEPPVSETQPESSKPQGSMFVMPNLIGQRYDSVSSSPTWKERLEFEVTYDYSDEYENGLIYEQDIEEGTTLYPVQKVKISVSKGLAVVEIPDFMNELGFRMTKEEYTAVLDSLNIKYEYRTVESFEMSGYVLGVYCPETGGEVGGEINVAEGNTLYVDISEFTPDMGLAG